MDERTEQITIYFRCGKCHLVGPCASLNYAAAPGQPERIDFSCRPAEARCSICSTLNDVPEDCVAPLETEVACPHCAAQVPCPAEASRVECSGCGLLFYGPAAADAAARQEVQIHEDLTRVEWYSRAPFSRD